MAGEMEGNQTVDTVFDFKSEDAEHEKDGGVNPGKKGKPQSKWRSEINKRGEPKGVPHDDLKSSRVSLNLKRKDGEVFPNAAISDAFGDSNDDNPMDYTVRCKINEESKCGKAKGNCSKELPVDGVPDKYGRPVVFEIPLCPPPADEDQMAIIKLSNIIGIDSKPFDPDTFVDEDLYVTDATGSERLIPSTNIIRWREKKLPDGKTEVESNARFVTWSDGRLQLLIGGEAFDVSEQDTREIQSHLFIKHDKGLYQSQGKICRKMKFTPSSLSSDTHRQLTALIDTRTKKVNKLQHYETDVDPEWVMEQNTKAEREITKANKQLNEKKKKKRAVQKCRSKGHKHLQLTTAFLEDGSFEDNKPNYYEPQNKHLDLELEKEAAAEERLMNVKKEPKDPRKSTSPSHEVTGGPLHIPGYVKVKEELGSEGDEAHVEDPEDEVSYDFHI